MDPQPASEYPIQTINAQGRVAVDTAYRGNWPNAGNSVRATARCQIKAGQGGKSAHDMRLEPSILPPETISFIIARQLPKIKPVHIIFRSAKACSGQAIENRFRQPYRRKRSIASHFSLFGCQSHLVDR
jgi:hypothetical protein